MIRGWLAPLPPPGRWVRVAPPPLWGGGVGWWAGGAEGDGSVIDKALELGGLVLCLWNLRIITWSLECAT
jgi:hypothetical protein